MSFWNKDRDLERIFAKAAPQTPEGLVERLASRPRTRSSRPALRRLAVAGAVSALLAAALASVGGISYAANFAIDVVTGHQARNALFGSEMGMTLKQHTAATDEYGNPDHSDQTQTVQSSPTQQTNAQVPLGNGTDVKITAPAGTFTDAVVVYVDPNPPTTQGVHFSGTDNKVVAISVSDQTGQPVHTLEKPMDIDLGAKGDDYVPSISEDGSAFRALKKVDGPDSALDPKHHDGYYISADNHVHILTLHLTIFAVLYKANLSISESGRTLKQPGSGQFGDPTLIHSGAANMKRVGNVKVFRFNKKTGWSGRAVRFTFFVDEQVAAYVSVWDGKKKLPIALRGTQIRGTTLLKKGTEKTLHIPVLRLGNLPLRLRIPGTHLGAGKHYRIRVATLDYDGNRTVQFIPFTG
ncbi:MAG TPA: hypothetical protein VFK17_02690 [Gaiellaceae bacterium]|nr:hypothetical protein [Gaiellaceae bacterium]